MIAKTPTERVTALRQRREALGLVRLDVYAHPEDHAALKIQAERLARRRARLMASLAPKGTA